MRVRLGPVGHFGIAVADPQTSAGFWTRTFDLDELFRYEHGVAVGNAAVTIVLRRGQPRPETLGHLSFHVRDMPALREAVRALREGGVELEDPGHEIGPEAPGSLHRGLWFHCPDGYRWELSVQNGGLQNGHLHERPADDRAAGRDDR